MYCMYYILYIYYKHYIWVTKKTFFTIIIISSFNTSFNLLLL